MTRKGDDRVYSLSFTLPLQAAEREARTYHLEAREAERLNLAERLSLIDVAALSADVSVMRLAPSIADGVEIRGQVRATITQRCGVSLEPVPESIDSPFQLWLVTPKEAARMDEEDMLMDPDAPEYEALEGDVLPVGEVVAQTLALVMDPFPRKSDAPLSQLAVANPPKKVTFDAPVAEETPARKNPFEALSGLGLTGNDDGK
ncbi:YceD family protein [Yunchengibacter salinarum]|uniref:YceD family protein n=1 Tax=Yunchengibacter salinarum TaxID=3133399 RepID=UPI0035B5DC43